DAAKTSSLLGLSGLCVTVRGILNPYLRRRRKQAHTYKSFLRDKMQCVAVLCCWTEFIKVKYTGSTYSKLMTVKHTNSIQLTDFKMI
ncbi:hypothetical protein ACW76N_004404, partial [Shigella flexneri]